MKKIGKEVLFIRTGERNPRNGEGTFIRLKDGGILYAYTHYYGEDWADHAIARICGCFSYDEGESWSEPVILIEKDENAQNIMSPSLIRCANGDILMVYLRKEVKSDNGITCMPVYSRSTDEGKSWTPWKFAFAKEGYYCVINDGVIVQKNGRILVPASFCGLRYDAFGNCTLKELEKDKCGYVYVSYSDDDGKTWELLDHEFISPYRDGWGLGEPGMYEHDNGDLWLWARTPYGFQYDCRSTDAGKSWSAVAPNLHFTSPDSPMRVKRVGKYVSAVFNPLPMHCLRDDREVWQSAKRTPFVCAISRDDARSFDSTGKSLANGDLQRFYDNCYLLEDDYSNSYCYPAIIETADGFLVAYYHSNGTPVCLNCAKISKVYFNEIEN